MKMITLTGEARWAKVFEDNREMKGYEDAYVPYNGMYEISLLLDDAELQKLRDSGSKLEGVEDEETGLREVKFKRKHEVRNSKTNEIIEEFCGAPVVKDADGNLWEHSEDEPNYIGNGSTVEVAITVTPDRKRKSIVYTRLEGLKVHELVEYSSDGAQPELPF